MNNNDILVRLRYALSLTDADMVEVFKMAGKEITKPEVKEMLAKKVENARKETHTPNIYVRDCDNETLDTFLNGLIISQRGKSDKEPQLTGEIKYMNNVLLKKMKIALTLTSEEMLEILDSAGVRISNSELSAVLRKEGHRNFKECGDRYARNFLKGLALRYRE